MQQFEFDPSSFSKKDYNIAGVTTHVYNGDCLGPYIDKINKLYADDWESHSKLVDIPIHVVYILHGRGQDYSYSESIAYTLLNQYYAKKLVVQVPLVCITFDMRNHGERLIDEARNTSWKSGNQTHALDMISSIDGNAADLKLIIEYLPSYLNLEFLLDSKLKSELGSTIKYVNILSGISLGGHTVIRFASQYPHLVDIINPIIGCNDLSTLLINRLIETPIDSPDYDKKLFYYNYDELPLSNQQRQYEYPEFFHKYLSIEDKKIWEDFPMSKIKLFATFGEQDTLVPPKLSKFWIESYLSTNDDSESFTQENAGHECTPEMIDKFTTWLAKIL